MNEQPSHLTVIVHKFGETANLWFTPCVLGLFLVGVANIHFLAFHTLAELFSIIISFVLFSMAWTTSRYHKNAFLIFLGCGYFWISGLDLAHTLVYKGMNVLVEGSGNLSSQFWIGTRYFEALLLLSAPFVIHKNINKYYLFASFGGLAAVLYASILYAIFPPTFIEGVGLTSFKVYSEYIIIVILLLALVALRSRQNLLTRTEFRLIVASVILTILAEVMFTLYIDVYGPVNFLGHVLKISSFWMIYQAVVATNLARPYEALIESRNYNRQLFDSSSIGLALAKMDGTLIDINQAYADIIGRTVDETLNLNYWNITPETFWDQEQKQLESLKSTGRYGPYIKEYMHKDGHLVPVQLSGTLIDHNGEPAIWSSVEEISARVEAEAAVQKHLDRLHRLTAHLPGFIYQYRLRPDGTSHFPYASEGIRNIYNCTPEDVVDDAAAVFDVLHPDDLERVSRSIQDSAANMTVWHDEYRCIFPDGRTIWLEGHASPIKEQDGAIVWHGYIQDVSERMATRQEIVHQRDQLRKYIDLAGTLVLAIDRDGMIDLINEHACNVLGYAPEELTGRDWFEIAIPPDVRDKIRTISLDITHGRREAVHNNENIILTHTGERRLIAWNYAYLRNPKGEIYRILASGIDITDERNSKLALERSNRALRTISLCNEALVHATHEDQLLQNICRVIVEEGGYMTVWTAFIRYNNGGHLVPTASYGPHREIINDVLNDINEHNFYASTKPIHFSSAPDTATLPVCEAVCRKVGSASLYMLPLKDAGAPIGALFLTGDDQKVVDDQEWALLDELASDLSYGIQALRAAREREYAMEKLSQSEERSLGIIEGAHDAIIAIDHAGRITQFNPAAQTMFGYGLTEVIGEDVHIIIPERYRDAHRKSIKNFAKTRKGTIFGKNLTLAALRSDGREFPIELTLSPMPDNTPDLCTAIIRDISDRDEADRQRRQAQNMESLGNLAGGMAHDINNMLLPILNLTAMVKRTLDPQSKEAQKLAMVLQASERVQSLVRRVLEFSRQDEPDYKDQNICDIVKNALPLITSTTPKSIELKADIREFNGVIRADDKQINAVLINLVTNATDAIGGINGHITIELKKARPTTSQLLRNPSLRSIDYAKLSVTDDGAGMSNEVIERMFDPFFTTKEPGKGTGLGMSMVHGVITKHGGTIDVQSREGEGTRVDLYIPLKNGPLKTKRKPKTPAGKKS